MPLLATLFVVVVVVTGALSGLSLVRLSLVG